MIPAHAGVANGLREDDRRCTLDGLRHGLVDDGIVRASLQVLNVIRLLFTSCPRMRRITIWDQEHTPQALAGRDRSRCWFPGWSREEEGNSTLVVAVTPPFLHATFGSFPPGGKDQQVAHQSGRGEGPGTGRGCGGREPGPVPDHRVAEVVGVPGQRPQPSVEHIRLGAVVALLIPGLLVVGDRLDQAAPAIITAIPAGNNQTAQLSSGRTLAAASWIGAATRSCERPLRDKHLAEYGNLESRPPETRCNGGPPYVACFADGSPSAPFRDVHPDPVRSGRKSTNDATCRRCRLSR